MYLKKLLLKYYKTAKIRKYIDLNTINNTLFVGKVLYSFENLPSTNTFAADLLAQKKTIEGTVIVAGAQTDGRGQQQNKWESEPHKNIAMSAIFYPTFLPLQKYFLLNRAVALAVYDTVRQFVDKDVKIKWSNDIYIEDKKVAGILIQNTIQGNDIQSSIIGIGINVNQLIFKSDAPNPTSIALCRGNIIDLDLVLNTLCKCLENRYLQLRQGREDELRMDYSLKLYRRDAWFHYIRTANGEQFLGRIESVKDSGHLIMETMRGLEIFDLKEIKFVVN